MKRSNRPLFTDDSAQRDAAWVEATLAGDHDAFGQIVEAYQRIAVSTAYRLLGHSEDAQDVAQNAFLNAFQSLSKLKDPRRLGPWLMRIVSNLALNFRRSRRSGSTVPLDEQHGPEGVARSGEPMASILGPERRAEGRELQEALDAALEQLPEKQRLTLLLFTVEGWPQKEIAELLECSLETVKWNVFQARKRLRGLLSDAINE
jgi:RNA polymerase sigma-70 factor (ECF subfamily)